MLFYVILPHQTGSKVKCRGKGVGRTFCSLPGTSAEDGNGGVGGCGLKGKDGSRS